MNKAISKLLACLPSIRESFDADGIKLPRQYLDAIENARDRDAGERDYQFYLDEVVFEAAALPYPWQPSVRHLLKPDERSAYLDEQARVVAPDAFSLDRNFNHFVGLRQHLSRDFRQALQAQKQREAELHAAGINKLCGGESQAALAAMEAIAGNFGFTRQPGGRTRSAIKFTRATASGAAVSIKLVDLDAFKNHGSVLVQYLFEDLTEKPFGLNAFLPGAVAYYHDNEGLDAMKFSFYLQTRFISEVADALGVGNV